VCARARVSAFWEGFSCLLNREGMNGATPVPLDLSAKLVIAVFFLCVPRGKEDGNKSIWWQITCIFFI